MIRLAVIGCGRIAGHHCRSARDVEGITLVAVSDLVEERAKDFSEEFGVPYYLDYSDLFDAHPEVDIVAVITPSGMHYEHSMEVLEKYEKHLIVEKPTFMRPSEVVNAYELANEKGVQIFPVFQNRYNRAVTKVRTGIANGELGAVRTAAVRVRWCRPQRYYDLSPWRGTFAMDGGALSNQGIHHLDLMKHLGGEITEVSATMRTLGSHIEVEDTVVGTVRFASGAVGTVEVTTAARPDDFGAAVSFVCENGIAEIGGIGVNELTQYSPDPASCQEWSEDFGRSVYGFGHEAMYKEVVSSLSDLHKYSLGYEDCLSTTELLHSFYMSHEENRTVPVKKAESSKLGVADEVLADLYRTPDKQRTLSSPKSSKEQQNQEYSR